MQGKGLPDEFPASLQITVSNTHVLPSHGQIGSCENAFGENDVGPALVVTAQNQLCDELILDAAGNLGSIIPWRSAAHSRKPLCIVTVEELEQEISSVRSELGGSPGWAIPDRQIQVLLRQLLNDLQALEIEAAARDKTYNQVSEGIKEQAAEAASRLDESLFSVAERLEELTVALPRSTNKTGQGIATP